MGNYQSTHPRISRDFYGTLFKDEEKEPESLPPRLPLYLSHQSNIDCQLI